MGERTGGLSGGCERAATAKVAVLTGNRNPARKNLHAGKAQAPVTSTNPVIQPNGMRRARRGAAERPMNCLKPGIIFGIAAGLMAQDKPTTTPDPAASRETKRTSGSKSAAPKTEAPAGKGQAKKSAEPPPDATQRERKADGAGSTAPGIQQRDPLRPDPGRPGTPPTFPPTQAPPSQSSPKTPVKPADPTAPTAVKP